MEQMSLTKKKLTPNEYNEICNTLDHLPVPSVCYSREDHLRSLYPHILLETIASIIQHNYQEKVKKCHFILRNKADNIYYRFLRGLQQQKTKVAFNLAIENRQPPYLVSQIILQKHFSKQWEDEKTKNLVSAKSNSPSKNKKSKNAQKDDKAPSEQNNIKRITPVQVNCKQEFPSLRETSVKQRRVTPTAVQNSCEPNVSNSSVLRYGDEAINPRTSLTSSPLSLCDVMVIKTKKNKKNSASTKNKVLNESAVTINKSNVCGDTRRTVMENLIQDKDKNKLFDRILNKTKTKESEIFACLEKDIKNNNVILESHLTPKKVKFNEKKAISNLVKKCNQNSNITESSVDSPRCPSVLNVTRLTPQRIAEEPVSNPEHQLSSIHFMTQNCQSKDELYEDYRYKLERLSERFTRQLTPETKLPSVTGESKEKIEKLTERMKKKTVTRVYLNSLDESARKKAEAVLLTKIEQDGKDREDNKPREILMRPEDLETWKSILRNHHQDPPTLVVKATEFWKKFSKNGKAVNGPKDFLKRMLRDPSIISDPILSKEIAYNNAMDDQYGPVADLYNRSVGILYEEKLTNYLNQCGISYKSEKLIMSLGFDKTPDVLVYPTLYIAGEPVNWIESKAVFGNPQNHEQYQRNQYCPYFERFGPGCVIYWFGHVDNLVPLPNQYIILTDYPARDLMQQSAVVDDDPVTFLQSCSSVITVDLERDKEVKQSPSKVNKTNVEQSPSKVNKTNGEQSPCKAKPIFASPRTNLKSPLSSQEEKKQSRRHSSDESPCTILSSQFSARINFSESPLPKCLFKSPSDKCDGNVAFSTPLKHIGNSSGGSSPAIKEETFDSGLEFPERRPQSETCRRLLSPEMKETLHGDVTSPEVSFSHKVPPVLKSSLDCSSISMCSMCDTSVTDKSECSLFRCVQSPPCFSSHCSDKLLSFTSPCSCTFKRDNSALLVLNTIDESYTKYK